MFQILTKEPGMTEQKIEYLISSEGQLTGVVEQMVPKLQGAMVITFSGDLGAGKTTLIKVLCKAWDVVDNVASPTFSIVNSYTTKEGNAIHHMDLYRLKDVQEALDIGIEEYWYDPNAITLIEWPEIVDHFLPDNTCKIEIEADESGQRKIVLLYST